MITTSVTTKVATKFRNIFRRLKEFVSQFETDEILVGVTVGVGGLLIIGLLSYLLFHGFKPERFMTTEEKTREILWSDCEGWRRFSLPELKQYCNTIENEWLTEYKKRMKLEALEKEQELYKKLIKKKESKK